jgi:hypothetical protein
MQRHRTNSRRRVRGKGDQGVIITLVAVFMLAVVGAMAALSIDIVTIYTARSEAQLAADAAALAAARTLANSGMTSDPTAAVDGVLTAARTLAITVATEVAQQNVVGGRNLAAGEVAVSYAVSGALPCNVVTNPCVSVKVQRTDVPTFFARIWGTTVVTIGATAVAEAYNASAPVGVGSTKTPVAPICVKPWLLPNLDPTNPTNTIFDPASGTITNAGLLGQTSSTTFPRMQADCTSCSPSSTPNPWQYYPGDPTSFPPPNASSVVCSGCVGFDSYQLSIAGCGQTPISCMSTVAISTAANSWDIETAPAVNGLTHSTANEGDRVDLAATPPPFQFLAGGDNPVVLSGAIADLTPITVSDSLVTVPVIDTSTWPPASLASVQIIGFVQLFLNPNGVKTPITGPNIGHMRTTVINMVGCGTGATGQPILGNGASPVAVRLVSP